MENLQDRQDNIDEVVVEVETVLDALRNAESCESDTDFDANIADALEALKQATNTLKELATRTEEDEGE